MPQVIPSVKELQVQLQKVQKEVEQLRAENFSLRKLLEENGIKYVSQRVVEKPKKREHNNLSVEQRVELFRSLFKGREDVFARRWQSEQTGKAGYQPVCRNEWRYGVCDKKKYKCAECPNREFLPLEYQHVYDHLAGTKENCSDVIGLYALTIEVKCHFLCTDFDDKSCEHGYKDDVLAFVGVCKEWNVPASIERSRSGNGAHVWLFFDDAIPAVKARKLGNIILNEAMNRNGKISFASYDRFFPNQDTMPEGGFGNLVALPLQGKARKDGNSVFVDEKFEPYVDQWLYLQHVGKMTEQEVDAIVGQHSDLLGFGILSKTSDKKPWETPDANTLSVDDFPKKVIIVKTNSLYFPLDEISPKIQNHLKRIASFKNPEFYKKEAMRFSTFDTPRIITCAHFEDDYLALPRGCESAVMKLLDEKGVNYDITDKCHRGNVIRVSFNGELYDEQQMALDSLLPFDNGILHATTAFGKTVTAAALIAKRKVNTLVLVHNKALLDQWKERLEEFLTLDYTEEAFPKKRGRKKTFSPIGTLCSTGNSLHGIVDIALMQSCLEDGEVKAFVKEYGMVIADEAQHVSSVTFEKVMGAVNAKYVYGLTATPSRKDGHHPIIFMQCGPIRFVADAKAQMERQLFKRVLIPRFTSYRHIAEEQNFVQIAQSLATDELRNKMIVEDVAKALTEGRTPIILSSLTAHVQTLAEMLRSYCSNVITLIGAEKAKDKQIAMERLQNVPTSEPLVIVATGKYVGEGFDYARLDTLFLALPISWKGLVAQYAGRLHRNYEGKNEVQIYDYVDIRVPICDIMYRRRLKAYSSIGYKPKEIPSKESAGEPSIVDGLNYLQTYLNSLTSARHFIILVCPKVKFARHSKIIERLKDLLSIGVLITIVTREENEHTSILSACGFDVIASQSLSLCCTIIDKHIVWYGSINPLAYVAEDDTAMRIDDAEIAGEMMEVALGYASI